MQVVNKKHQNQIVTHLMMAKFQIVYIFDLYDLKSFLCYTKLFVFSHVTKL